MIPGVGAFRHEQDRSFLGVELERARALYIKRATRPEQDALLVKESHAKSLLDKSARTRAKRDLPELRRRLALAERLEGEIFDAVIRGEREP